MADETNGKAEAVGDGGEAFPLQDLYVDGQAVKQGARGMTLRQYAAIHLRQPNSGLPWLDEMIRDAKRDELAAKAPEGEADAPWFTEPEPKQPVAPEIPMLTELGAITGLTFSVAVDEKRRRLPADHPNAIAVQQFNEATSAHWTAHAAWRERQSIARRAAFRYARADAMLAARNRK